MIVERAAGQSLQLDFGSAENLQSYLTWRKNRFIVLAPAIGFGYGHVDGQQAQENNL